MRNAENSRQRAVLYGELSLCSFLNSLREFPGLRRLPYSFLESDCARCAHKMNTTEMRPIHMHQLSGRYKYQKYSPGHKIYYMFLSRVKCDSITNS